MINAMKRLGMKSSTCSCFRICSCLAILQFTTNF
jgi:hypothetical protein